MKQKNSEEILYKVNLVCQEHRNTLLLKLRKVHLHSNQLQEIPLGLFDNNLNLEYMEFGSGLFNGLTKLTKVDFNQNICVEQCFSTLFG